MDQIKLEMVNEELLAQNKEKEEREAELIVLNKKLASNLSLLKANKKLKLLIEERKKRFVELIIANTELENLFLFIPLKTQYPLIISGYCVFVVPRTRLELAHRNRNQPLKLACLPISPSGQIAFRGCKYIKKSNQTTANPYF